jgi:hypothetical protein
MKEGFPVNLLLTRCRLAPLSHVEVNAAALSDTPLIESQDDFFDGPGYGTDTTLPVATDPVTALNNHIAVPIHTVGSGRRFCGLNRQNLVRFPVD